MSVDVLPFDIAAPDDLAALAEAVDTIGADSIVRMALFLRVPGEYEDGSREAARAALEAFLVARALSERCEYITVIGTEGVTTACGYALIETASSPDGSQARRLAIGLARSGPPEEASIGTAALRMRLRRSCGAPCWTEGWLRPTSRPSSSTFRRRPVGMFPRGLAADAPQRRWEPASPLERSTHIQ